MKREVKEIYALLIALATTLFFVVIISIVFNSILSSVKLDIKQKRNEYLKVLSLYKKIKNNRSSKKMFNNNILLFVQKLGSVNGLRKKIVSVNTTGASGNVEIKIVAVNLRQIMDIFKTINEYKNIKIMRFILKRDFSFPDLADLNITIGKVM